ncbi:BLUF domain-containing protein, partial [Delftia acidovorans]|uniref:BLUF domain-containing protein n=1 Tax=Delftia acidovorans TaxID=80866 RepID=UPI0012D7D098
MGNNLLECFLYQSKLAPGVDTTCVAQIVKTARAFNEKAQITGILVFDGEVFCQYIEGPSYQVQNLITLLTRDPRHVNFTPLLHLHRQPYRRFSKWTMAYHLVDDAEVLEGIGTGPGEFALEKLQQLIPQLDTD